jgi:uncharacterized lipoprotein YddW (UPF0748 family)
MRVRPVPATLGLAFLVASLAALGACSLRRLAAERLRSEPKPIYLWMDATANLQRLSSEAAVRGVFQQCAETGITAVVIDVKPISGHVLYNSEYAPRLRRWPLRDGTMFECDPNFDLVATACSVGHEMGLQVFASMNVFAGGHKQIDIPNDRERGPTYDDKEAWAAWDYVQLPGESRARLRPTTEHSRSYTAFLSPLHPEVRAVELSIMRELAERYPIDGLSLDRARFDDLYGDFSPWARQAFEQWLGRRVELWPRDIYTRTGTGPDDIEHGPLWNQWLLWRAQVIHDFIVEAREHVKAANPNCVFADYVGAWYPVYYEAGVNWARPGFIPPYPGFPPRWEQTGYADQLDLLFAGTYFYAVTPDEITPHPRGFTGPWLSVQGSAQCAMQAVGGACPVVGSLYVEQYAQEAPGGQMDRSRFARALREAYADTDGLMIFDLVHLDEQRVWDVLEDFCAEVQQRPTAEASAASDEATGP